MGLTAGLNIARSSLATSAGQTEIVSRNIANVNDPNYRRKSANLASLETGGVHIASIARTTNQALFTKVLTASSSSAMYGSLLSGLNFLSQTVGDPEDDSSPAANLGKLANALQLYSVTPGDTTAASNAVAAARDMANALNAATQAVQGVRTQADADMSSSVERINSLLSQLESVNAAITGASPRADVTDHLDTRDKILSQLSGELGIRVVEREGNDIAVYTDSGVTLFDGKARSVTMQPTSLLTAGADGNAVFIDGVQVTGQGATMALRSGSLVGLAKLRDEVAPTYQMQLDEIARGLIETFAEKDQGSPASLPDIPGLFTWSGSPAMPAAGSVNTGLAGMIRIAASVDPNQGGNPALLRDGGIGDPGNPAYVYNDTGAASFSDRLRDLLSGLTAQRSFDTVAGIGANATLANFASSSAGWLEGLRSSTSNEADYRDTLLTRASDSLSKATGVNLDEEMTLMLDLERSYQASAKLIATIDSMFAMLLEAVG